jgi:endonuclease/exonuclease/phosphatase family metal-dependent hydrolase
MKPLCAIAPMRLNRLLRIVSYTIHKRSGLDCRVRPARIPEVLDDVTAHTIALRQVLRVEAQVGFRESNSREEARCEDAPAVKRLLGELVRRDLWHLQSNQRLVSEKFLERGSQTCGHQVQTAKAP